MKTKHSAASLFLAGLCFSLTLTGCGKSNSAMSAEDAQNFKGKPMTADESAQKMQEVDARMKKLHQEQNDARAKAGLPPLPEPAAPPK